MIHKVMYGEKRGEIYENRAYIAGIFNTDGHNGEDSTVMSTKWSE